ncbi:MAG: hypothetical protein RLO21_22560 [Nitratireductor sp.]
MRTVPSFAIRKVPPPTAAERQARRDAMERAIKFGAAPYRDAEGKARYVSFREANSAPVEAWTRHREAKRGYRRTQYARKAAGQMAWHPEDQIELGKRLGVIYRREGRSVEGAAERGLYDAIWRYEHVFGSFTVPRRFGRDTIETGRIAAVAEEEARKLQDEDPRAQGGFWVRDRKNNGLIYVVPNPAPVVEAAETALSNSAIVGGGGEDVLFGQTNAVTESEAIVLDEEPTSSEIHTEAAEEPEQPPALSYPDIPLPALEPTWQAGEDAVADGNGLRVINMEKDRIRNILDNRLATFEVNDWANADGREPEHAIHEAGYWAVWVHQDVIEHEAKAAGINPDLVRAIVYVENAQGWYGRIPQQLGLARTLLPMNINPNTWGRLVEGDADFHDPIDNIRAGVRLIRRLYERIPDATVAKVASPFKFTGMENVSDYGARVAEVYAARTWEQRPEKFTEAYLGKLKTRDRAILERQINHKVRERNRLRGRVKLLQ